MRPSIYNPRIVSQICLAIKKTGRDKSGIEAGGISKATFYRWENKHPEFFEKVEHAKRQYRMSFSKYAGITWARAKL